LTPLQSEKHKYWQATKRISPLVFHFLHEAEYKREGWQSSFFHHCSHSFTHTSKQALRRYPGAELWVIHLCCFQKCMPAQA